MTYYRRIRAGRTYFFTLVAFHRRPILCDPTIRGSLRHAISHVRRVRPFSIDAWVLLPDHMHCIWTLPDGDTDFSTRWALIKQSVSRFSPGIALPSHTRSTSARKHRESTIWQRRFWEHMIRDDTDFERHLDYIHFNPVRHGYVGRAVDWPYSTIFGTSSEACMPRIGVAERIPDGAISNDIGHASIRVGAGRPPYAPTIIRHSSVYDRYIQRGVYAADRGGGADSGWGDFE